MSQAVVQKPRSPAQALSDAVAERRVKKLLSKLPGEGASVEGEIVWGLKALELFNEGDLREHTEGKWLLLKEWAQTMPNRTYFETGAIFFVVAKKWIETFYKDEPENCRLLLETMNPIHLVFPGLHSISPELMQLLQADKKQTLSVSGVEASLQDKEKSSVNFVRNLSGNELKNNSYDFKRTSDKKELFTPDTNEDEIREETEEGKLRRENKEKRLKYLTAYFDASGVPESERPPLIKEFEIKIARATRPKWLGRQERGGELATLSAPNFLKRVHAEDIAADGTVENETIRAIDPDLMKAVESYASNRRTRPDGDMGDAADLHFNLTHPGKGNRGVKAGKPSP